MKYIAEYNPISMCKIARNICKYFWIILICIGISVGIIFLGNIEGDSETVKDYTITLCVKSEVYHQMLEEKYYEKELEKQILYESIRRVFQTTDVINKELKKEGYDNLMPTEVPTYSEYVPSNNLVTLKVSSINKKRAVLILKLYEEEMSKACQAIDSEFNIEKIAQSKNMKNEVENTGGKRNLLILCAGGMLGIIVLGFLILVDDKIYSEKELKSCFNYNKFGYIVDGEIQLNGPWVDSYCIVNSIKKIVFMEQVKGLIFSEKNKSILKDYKISVCTWNSDEYCYKVIESDAICVCVILGKTKVSEINLILENLGSLGCSVDGCLLQK